MQEKGRNLMIRAAKNAMNQHKELQGPLQMNLHGQKFVAAAKPQANNQKLLLSLVAARSIESNL